MKPLFNKIFFAGLLLVLFTGCKKNVATVYYQGGTAPVLTASVADSVPLLYVNADQTALVLSWTNPDYQFSTGVSSLDVTYTVEIDTTGSNFTNPGRKTIAVSKDLGLTITTSQLNDYMLNQLLLAVNMEHHLEIRVTSSLANNKVALTSNVLKFAATPYSIPPKITPPTSGTLFIVGAATKGGWDNPMTVDPKTQQFTQVSLTEYKITIYLNGGGEYKLIAANGSWNEQWSVKTGDTYPSGGPFVANGGNSIAPAASGTYVIDVDFQHGQFTVTPQ